MELKHIFQKASMTKVVVCYLSGNSWWLFFFNCLYIQSDRLCHMTKNKIDPICENCVVRHFQISYDTIFTNICWIV
jgi:hypothetical protein